MTENDEEKDNHFDENQSDNLSKNKKRKFRLNTKRKILLLFLVVLVGFLIVGINFKDKKKYENAAIAQTKTENFEKIKDMENKFNMEKEENNNIKKINVNNMKISTPEQCKEKGLYYIGKMNVSRYSPNVSKINENELLILGGLSKDNIESNMGEYIKRTKKSAYKKKELNAEIFSINTFESKLLENKPYSAIHYYSTQLMNGDILFPSSMEVYINKLKNFKKLNIENYNDKYCDCINYDNEKILCIYNRYLSNDSLKSVLFNYNENLSKTFVPISDSLINHNNELLRNKLLKINNENIIMYSYYMNFSNKNNKIYFYKFDKKKNIFNKSSIIGLDGNTFAVEKITDELLLINSININDNVSILYLYNFNKNQIINKYPLKQQYLTIRLEDGNIVLYNTDKKQYYIGYIFNSKLLKLIPINQKIIMPIWLSKVYPINKNQLLFIGGKYKSSNEPTNDIYLYTF